MEQSLRGHPFHRQSAIGCFAVIVMTVDVPRETKIGNLQNIIITHQHVSGGQIAVDTLQSENFFVNTTTLSKLIEFCILNDTPMNASHVQ